MPARRFFVIAQVAASVPLIVASGLLVRTLLSVEEVDAGFNRTQNAVLLSIALNQDGPQRLATIASLVDRVNALPGVTNVSVARGVPLAEGGSGATKLVLAEDELASPTAGTPVRFNQVDEKYFRLMGITLLAGRDFGRQDTLKSVRVAVINRTLARGLFFGGEAIGKHLKIGREKPVDLEIAGVTEDGKYNDLTEAPQPYLYLPLTQDSSSEVTLIAATAGDPNPLLPIARKAVREVDASIVIESATTMKDRMSFATYGNRLEAFLTASLGALALLLTVVGLYGVVSYTVSRRTHEIGIRMAMGAARGRITSQIVREGLKPVLIGMVVGILLALLLGRAMSDLLYGVKPSDPITLLITMSLMIAISSLALVGPVRRALRIHPMDALRED